MQLKKPLTKHGQSILADEHHELSSKKRPEILRNIAIAAAEGDRSENAEYIYGRKLLRDTDKRIQYLHKLLDGAQLIDEKKVRSDCVCFASLVQIEDEDGVTKEWYIVGEGETTLQHNLPRKGIVPISWKSPIARAIFGKKVGDVVLAYPPKGETELTIIALDFLGAH